MRSTCVFAMVPALILGLAAPALAQPVDTPAEWIKKPTRESLVSAMPFKALEAGVGGEATIACVLTIQGALRGCRVQSETPPAMGFGGAAISLSGQFLMKPALRGGQPVESTVVIPLTFADPGPPRTMRKTGRRVTRMMSNVAWVSAPSAADVLAAWPEKVRAAGQGGNAVLNCAMMRDGDLNDCQVVRQEPFGAGFAGAAQDLVRKFRGPPIGDEIPTTDSQRTQIVFSFPADAAKSGTPPLGKPQWLKLPTQQDMADRLPAQARAAGVFKARVVMSCVIAANGALGDCNVDSAEPSGLGFGAAAVDLGGIMRTRIWTAEGLPTIGGKVTLPLRFDLTGLAAAPPP